MSTSMEHPASQCSLYIGLDVHKESVTIAVLPAAAAIPSRIDKEANDCKVLRRYFTRLAAAGEIRACYEASGAGYVLQRALTEWGYHCDVIAPSLIPQKPGHQRKHDRYDAKQLAHLYRSGELTPIRIPTEAEERVRDLVRCRATFQRELLRARHYILKFLTRRGLRYTAGKCHWTRAHHAWLAQLSRTSVLAAEDQVIFSEFLGLLRYAQQRRDALDDQIEHLALAPTLRESVAWLSCLRGINTPAARPAAAGRHARLEGAASVAQTLSPHRSAERPAGGRRRGRARAGRFSLGDHAGVPAGLGTRTARRRRLTVGAFLISHLLIP